MKTATVDGGRRRRVKTMSASHDPNSVGGGVLGALDTNTQRARSNKPSQQHHDGRNVDKKPTLVVAVEENDDIDATSVASIQPLYSPIAASERNNNKMDRPTPATIDLPSPRRFGNGDINDENNGNHLGIAASPKAAIYLDEQSDDESDGTHVSKWEEIRRRNKPDYRETHASDSDSASYEIEYEDDDGDDDNEDEDDDGESLGDQSFIANHDDDDDADDEYEFETESEAEYEVAEANVDTDADDDDDILSIDEDIDEDDLVRPACIQPLKFVDDDDDSDGNNETTQEDDHVNINDNDDHLVVDTICDDNDDVGVDVVAEILESAHIHNENDEETDRGSTNNTHDIEEDDKDDDNDDDDEPVILGVVVDSETDTESEAEIASDGPQVNSNERSDRSIQHRQTNSRPVHVSSPSDQRVNTAVPKEHFNVAVNEENDGMNGEAQPRTYHQVRKQDTTVRRGTWSFGSEIGEGSSGVVHMGMNHRTGQIIAIKTIKLEPKALKAIGLEVKMLKSFQHTNIVRYLGSERTGNRLHIFQEWVPGGSVSSLLRKFGPFSMHVVRSYLFQILNGLAYLHENRILYRDIKGGNVLISNDGIVKLADFGSSKRLAYQQADRMENHTICGTPYFMAPEVFEHQCSVKADVWSVGCVAYQMATSLPPWQTLGLKSTPMLFMHLKNTEGTPTMDVLPKNVKGDDSTVFQSMLEKTFARDPNRRPTTQGLLADPFFGLGVTTEDDSSHYTLGLFSPGGESHSTLGGIDKTRNDGTNGRTGTAHPTTFVEKSQNTNRPKTSEIPASPGREIVVSVAKNIPRTPFMSPPLPKRVQLSYHTASISPLRQDSPVVNTSEWPAWAKEKYREQEQRASDDSLARSEDSASVAIRKNPFARKAKSDNNSPPLSKLGATSGSASTLNGLQFL